MTVKKNQTNNLDIALSATYFFVVYYGLRIALENYLMEDLDISYSMLLGLVSAIPSSIYLTILKPKTWKVKIVGLSVLVTAMIIVNLLIN